MKLLESERSDIWSGSEKRSHPPRLAKGTKTENGKSVKEENGALRDLTDGDVFNTGRK